MKKKFIIPIIALLVAIIAVLALLLFNVSKGVNNDCADAKFISRIEKNLKARDNLTADFDKSLESYKNLIAVETSIYEYENATFQDMRLKKIAEDYINGVRIQEKSLDLYSDDLKFYDEWQKGYNIRSVAVSQLINEYNIKIPEEAKEDLLSNVKAVEINEKEKETVNALCNSIIFERTDSVGTYGTYTAVVENTTPYKFDNISLEIKLIKDDITQDTTYSSTLNWNPKEKAKFEFLSNEEFDKYEIEASYTIAD